MYIPRLRYINDAVKEMKENDPACPVTYYLIRTLIEKGVISKIKYGSAWLVNMDELFKVMGGKIDENI